MPLSHPAQAALPAGRSQTPGPLGRDPAIVACQLTAVPLPFFEVEQSIGEGAQPGPRHNQSARTSQFSRGSPHVFLHHLTKKLARHVFTTCTCSRNALTVNSTVSASTELKTNSIVGIHENNGGGAVSLLTQTAVQPFQQTFHSPLIPSSLRCSLWSGCKIHATDRKNLL